MTERDAVPDFNPRNPVGEVIKSLGLTPPPEFGVDISPGVTRPKHPTFPPDTPIIIVPDEVSLKNLARPIVVADRAGYDKMREVLKAGGLI